MKVIDTIMQNGTPNKVLAVRLGEEYGHALALWSAIYGIPADYILNVPGEEKLESLMDKEVVEFGNGQYGMMLKPETDPIIMKWRKSQMN